MNEPIPGGGGHALVQAPLPHQLKGSEGTVVVLGLGGTQ